MFCKCSGASCHCLGSKVALSSAYLVLQRDHSPSLCFTEPPDKQFCAHNKDFTHENVFFFLSFLDIFSGLAQSLSLQVERRAHLQRHIWIWNVSREEKLQSLISHAAESADAPFLWGDFITEHVVPRERFDDCQTVLECTKAWLLKYCTKVQFRGALGKISLFI